MSVETVKGVVRNRRIETDIPAEWPEGMEVQVSVADSIDDLQTDNSPEAIARWIAAFDAIPPLVMTAEEEAEWQADRQRQKDYEKSIFFEEAEKLRRMIDEDLPA